MAKIAVLGFGTVGGGVAQVLEENRDKLIVAIVCDFGERYISTVLYEDIRG